MLKWGNKFLIKAGSPPPGQKFSKWEVTKGNASIKQSNEPVTIVEIKSKDSVIKAIYAVDEDAPIDGLITIRILAGQLFRERVDGEGEDSDYQKVGNSFFENSSFPEDTDLTAQSGDKFLIRAKTFSNQEFSKWKIQKGNAEIAEKTETETIVTMGSESSIVAATYTRASITDPTGNFSDIRVESGQLFEEDLEAKEEIQKLYEDMEKLEDKLEKKLKALSKKFKTVEKD